MGDFNDEPKDSSIQFLLTEANKSGVSLVNLMGDLSGAMKGSMVESRRLVDIRPNDCIKKLDFGRWSEGSGF